MPPKLAYNLPEFCRATGLSRTAVYGYLQRKQLKARKSGRCNIILADDGEEFLQSLPAREPRADDEDGRARHGPDMKPPAA